MSVHKNPSARTESDLPKTPKMTNEATTGKLKGAIVGLGFISGKGHLPAYLKRDDVQIMAVADISRERREYAQKMLPGAQVFSDYESLLKACAKELDFVDISTPPAYHAEYATLALKQGLHVLCEKPLTVSVKEAQQLLVDAQKYRRVVFPCHNYKHAPVVKAVKEIIASGEIGLVTDLTMCTYRTTHARGVEEWNTNWRREKKYSGGGIAMDHGSHTFYLTFDWLQSLPTSVTAKMATRDLKWDTEDQFSCVLTYPTGSVTAHLSWTAGTRKVLYSIQGTQGAILVDDDDIQVSSQILQLESTGVSAKTRRLTISSDWADASHVDWFNSMFDEFRQCIRNSDYVNRELREAYACIQIIMTSYESAQKKCVELKLDQSFDFLAEAKS